MMRCKAGILVIFGMLLFPVYSAQVRAASEYCLVISLPAGYKPEHHFRFQSHLKKTEDTPLSYCPMDFTEIISPDGEDGFAVIKLVKVPAVFMIEAGELGAFYIYFVGVENITFNRHEGIQDCLGELPKIPFDISTIHAGEDFKTRHCQDVKVYRFSDYLVLKKASLVFRGLLMPKPVPLNFMGLKNKDGWVSGVSGSFQHAGLDVCLSFDPPEIVKVEETVEVKQPFIKEEGSLVTDSATSHSDSVRPDGEGKKIIKEQKQEVEQGGEKKKKRMSSRKRRELRELKEREEKARRLEDTATVTGKAVELRDAKDKEHRMKEPIVVLNETPASELGVAGAHDIAHDTGGLWVTVGRGGKPKKEKKAKQKTIVTSDLPQSPKQPPKPSAAAPVTSMAKDKGGKKKETIKAPSSVTEMVLPRRPERTEGYKKPTSSYTPPRGYSTGSKGYQPTPPSKGGNKGGGIGVVSQKEFDSLRGLDTPPDTGSSEAWSFGGGGTNRMKRRM